MSNHPQKQKKNRWRPFSILGWIAVFIICMLVVRYFFIQSYRISTTAMQEALYPGDYVLVNKWHTAKNPGRNRVVLFTSPLAKDSLEKPLFISRCVGMPGDTIRVSDEGYYINGRLMPFPPSALNSYKVDQQISDSFIRAMRSSQATRRSWLISDSLITLDLTPFEEYQLREELTDQENPYFRRQPITPYSLVVPRKDRIYWLDTFSLQVCGEAILRQAGASAAIREGALYIDGRKQDYFFFEDDYYWLLSDNYKEGIDSRFLGFVPSRNITGNIWLCWYSKAKGQLFKNIH